MQSIDCFCLNMRILEVTLYPYKSLIIDRPLLPSNSENCEHLKIFRKVDCVLANHNKVQNTRANLKATN